MIFKDDDFWKPVITTRQVIEGTDTVACLTLDDDDLDAISVEEMLQSDPTLAFAPDMECGESAVRDSKDTPWEIVKE